MSTPTRALAVYAHPDDPEVACGGTLIGWARDGADILIVVVARGEKGSLDPEVDPEKLASIRLAEAAAADRVLGVRERLNLGLADGEIENTTTLREELVRAVREFRPEVVLTHDPTAVFFGSGYVNHHDHRELGWAVLDSCAPSAASPLYFPGTGPAHQVRAVYLSGTLEPDTFIDVSGSLEAKAEALSCHSSQLGDRLDLVGDLVRESTAEQGRREGLGHAESFRVVTFS
ncbi:MAG: N-acetyl-alpha-D-glucosaminyl L-malate deacetylase 1 [Acidimicrobiales bacterium]|nr:MAG: PIG-L family deacetylase [Actinomycetota bacterium]MBV6508777.1 N-acetyl-alpha-D-glucosaminyl L-malate deacetylase 1 [Acidimicrobiales bacterium]RIK03641.1 MAG: PIG-L family deacetylase [Acidobacteriota bacterium]